MIVIVDHHRFRTIGGIIQHRQTSVQSSGAVVIITGASVFDPAVMWRYQYWYTFRQS
jgi:hypothetical protein